MIAAFLSMFLTLLFQYRVGADGAFERLGGARAGRHIQGSGTGIVLQRHLRHHADVL